jgi:RHS repeat-associated protein
LRPAQPGATESEAEGVNITHQFDYSEYGVPYGKPILWDGVLGFDDVEPLNKEETEILLTPPAGSPALSTYMVGAAVRVVTPDDAPYVMFGFVTAVDTGNGTFTVESGTGDMYHALASLDGVLTVFEHYDATLVSGPVHTAGTWDYAPSYSSGTGLTTFTSGTSVFEDHFVGWFLQPDGRSASYFPIVDVTSTTLVVAGNVSTLAGIGDVYFIVPPVGVDRDTGTFNGLKGGFFGGDQNLTRGTFIRNLAWGYRYIPPAVGIFDNSTVYGRQPGDNLAGQYSVWHRVYDPVQGRWTTPDPAERAWWKLLDYVNSTSLTVSDPTGLDQVETWEEIADEKWYDERGRRVRNPIEESGNCNNRDEWAHGVETLNTKSTSRRTLVSRRCVNARTCERIVRVDWTRECYYTGKGTYTRTWTLITWTFNRNGYRDAMSAYKRDSTIGATAVGVGSIGVLVTLFLVPEPVTTIIGFIGLGVSAVGTAIVVHNPPTRGQFTTRTEKSRRHTYRGNWTSESWTEWWVRFETERYPCDCWNNEPTDASDDACVERVSESKWESRREGDD